MKHGSRKRDPEGGSERGFEQGSEQVPVVAADPELHQVGWASGKLIVGPPERGSEQVPMVAAVPELHQAGWTSGKLIVRPPEGMPSRKRPARSRRMQSVSGAPCALRPRAAG